MNKIIAAAMLVLAVIVVSGGCSGEKPANQDQIAKVNDFVITADRLREKITVAANYQGRGTVDFDQRRRVLDQEIEKELLIQEAARRGLHKTETFRRAIEEYWERTLITDLVKNRMSEVQGKVMVTEEELAARYAKMKQADPSTPPLEKVRDQIRKELRDQKEHAALKQWIKSLREQASIQVDEDKLRQMR